MSPDRFGDSLKWPTTQAEYVAADADGAAAMWTTLLSTAVNYATAATIF
ncbi:hypothetical protein ACSDR0_46945 [Streptosporangium sp. G11]